MATSRLPRARRSPAARSLLIVGLGEQTQTLATTLASFAWSVEAVNDCQTALSQLPRLVPTVILTSCTLADGTWRDLLTASQHCPHPPRVLVTSRIADERLWAEVLNRGGFDLLPHPLEVGPLIRTIEAAYRDFVVTLFDGSRKPVQSATGDLLTVAATS